MVQILTVAVLSLVVSIRSGVAVAAEPPDWAQVSAIFVERCVMCHSPNGASLDLRLDTYEAAVAGSIRGAVLVPGDPAGSELLRRLRGESLPRMPFLSYPLPPEQIELISRWVEAGLPEVRGGATVKDRAESAPPGQSPAERPLR
jgi:hypothetical protein